MRNIQTRVNCKKYGNIFNVDLFSFFFGSKNVSFLARKFFNWHLYCFLLVQGHFFKIVNLYLLIRLLEDLIYSMNFYSIIFCIKNHFLSTVKYNLVSQFICHSANYSFKFKRPWKFKKFRKSLRPFREICLKIAKSFKNIHCFLPSSQ